MSKNKIMIIIIIFISVIIISLYGTFAMITNQVNETKNVDFAFIIGKNTNQEIIISSNTTKTFDITLDNPYEGPLNYGLTYSVNENYDINIGVLNTSQNTYQDIIEAKESKIISLMINNPTEDDITVNISVVTGYINGGELIIENDQQLISKTVNINDILNTNLDESGANIPDITNGMIPIYFSEEDNLWRKADQSNTNTNYEWYDYNEKKWANVALVTQESLEYNQKLKVGEIINQEDVLAYLVWIPRFKYQVWDIEMSNDESKYYYNAIKDGISIVFESSTSTTGEIICQEDNICTGENGQYYTHPAFYFGNKELTGFWIGKFETTGTKDNPTILPNYISLTFLNITEEIATSKLLTETENYNLKESGLDSHVIKDLEWSAVSYLTNSIYGTCNGAKNGCRNIYKNNSLYFNTGTSAGNNIETSNFGSYSYLGEQLDELGSPTEIIDATKIGSTTGNVYGVYDMFGGAYETVMLTNNKESEYLKEIDLKYYNLTIEKPLLGESFYELPIEVLIDEEIWYTRGGSSEEENASINSTKTYNGDSQEDVSFRIILS